MSGAGLLELGRVIALPELEGGPSQSSPYPADTEEELRDPAKAANPRINSEAGNSGLRTGRRLRPLPLWRGRNPLRFPLRPTHVTSTRQPQLELLLDGPLNDQPGTEPPERAQHRLRVIDHPLDDSLSMLVCYSRNDDCRHACQSTEEVVNPRLPLQALTRQRPRPYRDVLCDCLGYVEHRGSLPSFARGKHLHLDSRLMLL
jgi:hypothetical protein